MKRFLPIVICLIVMPLHASTLSVDSLLTFLPRLGSEPQVIEQNEQYIHIQTTEQSELEIMNYEDSTLVIQTVCAPRCSSCARVYDKEWNVVRILVAPFVSAFPLAKIVDGHIQWTDNQPQDESF